MKPSDFNKKHPIGSVMRKSEAETIAHNIITILSRTGDTWRKLPYEEYEFERLKDGGYSKAEAHYFNQVIGYCKNPDTCKLFAPAWKQIAEIQTLG